jgi:predicted site-specific integrase-resolvase
MATPTNPELVRATKAAKRLGVHPVTLKRWSDSGRIPQPVRLGPRGDRFYVAALIDQLAGHRSETEK